MSRQPPGFAEPFEIADGPFKTGLARSEGVNGICQRLGASCRRFGIARGAQLGQRVHSGTRIDADAHAFQGRVALATPEIAQRRALGFLAFEDLALGGKTYALAQHYVLVFEPPRREVDDLSEERLRIGETVVRGGGPVGGIGGLISAEGQVDETAGRKTYGQTSC